MAKERLNNFIFWHRKIASIFYFFFFIIAISGILLGWKFFFVNTIFEDGSIQPSKNREIWLPLDSLENKSTRFLNEKTNNFFSKSDKIEIRPINGYISFYYGKHLTTVVDGATGAVILIAQDKAGFIRDIHEGSLFENFPGFNSGWFKVVYCTFIGLALALLTISGAYMWDHKKETKD